MKNQSKEGKTIPISTRISKKLYQKLQDYMKEEGYNSISDAVRGIIRDSLKKWSSSSRPSSDKEVREEGR